MREFEKRGKREERARNYYLGIKGRGVVRREEGKKSDYVFRFHRGQQKALVNF